MIQKPFGISIQNKIIDGNEEYQLSWKTSGDIPTSFSIYIYENETGTLQWSGLLTGTSTQYTLPSKALSNGLDYKLQIKAMNDVSETAYSDFIVFSTLSEPVVVADLVDTVDNQSYVFSAKYSQNEGDPLNTYSVNLYDVNKNLIQTSGILTDGALQHRFDLLQSDTLYYVEFVVTCKRGLESSSGLVQFSVNYTTVEPPMEVSVTNVPDTASAKLEWKVNQVIGKSENQIEYINSEVDLRNTMAFFDEDFEINSDFTLKIWLREVNKDVDLIYLKGSSGILRVQYKTDDKFYLYKEVDGLILSTIATPVLTNGLQFFLCIQQINGNLSITAQAEVLSTSVKRTISNNYFTNLANVTFSDLKHAKFY